MPTSADINVHRTSMQYDLHQTTQALNEGLGPTLVSLLAGSKDQKASIRWARPDGPTPRMEARSRLLAAFQAWVLVETTHNATTARNWFLAANPRLDDDAPVERLRDGDTKAVLRAARLFSTMTR